MAMSSTSSKLIVPEAAVPAADGVVLEVTPESAGWQYVGYATVRLQAGQTFVRETGEKEVCLVLLGGRCGVKTAEREWAAIGGRTSPFDEEPPYAVYVPAGDRYEVTALTDLEFGVCSAPASGKLPARLIEPGDVKVEVRGSGSMERIVRNILMESSEAESLLVVEVITPEGHWSSYPPHKHDRDALPDESFLEETYYFKVKPEQGFAIQRVYTDDRSLDETLTVMNGQTVLVPKGYHPVSAPAGYEVYYLNVMAGPVRTWKIHNDPDHEWLLKK